MLRRYPVFIYPEKHEMLAGDKPPKSLPTDGFYAMDRDVNAGRSRQGETSQAWEGGPGRGLQAAVARWCVWSSRRRIEAARTLWKRRKCGLERHRDVEDGCWMLIVVEAVNLEEKQGARLTGKRPRTRNGKKNLASIQPGEILDTWQMD